MGGIAKLTATGEKMLFGAAVKDALLNSKFFVPNEINATAIGTSSLTSGLKEGVTAAERDLGASAAGFATSVAVVSGIAVFSGAVVVPAILATLAGYAVTKAVAAVFDTWDATHTDAGLIHGQRKHLHTAVAEDGGRAPARVRRGVQDDQCVGTQQLTLLGDGLGNPG